MKKNIFIYILCCVFLFSCDKKVGTIVNMSIGEDNMPRFNLSAASSRTYNENFSGKGGESTFKSYAVPNGDEGYIYCSLGNTNNLTVVYEWNSREINKFYIYADFVSYPVDVSDFFISFRGVKYYFEYKKGERFYSVKIGENNEMKIEVVSELPQDVQNRIKESLAR